MKLTKKYCRRLRQLIGENELESVFQELTRLLQNSPRLDEAIMQSARWSDLQKQVSLGLLSYEQSEIGKNKIRTGLLALVKEVEKKMTDPAIDEEMAEHASAVSRKNIVSDSKIQAGGDVNIGDQIQQFTESATSRKLRLFLFILVPFLALATSFLYYQYQQLQDPLTLTVSLDNQTPNKELDKDFKGGKLILRYGVKMDTLSLFNEATFKGIPANFRGKKVMLRFFADGFQSLDTLITLKKDQITLPLFRDRSYAHLAGLVTDEFDNPIADATIAAAGISRQTNEQGRFTLEIPFEKQRKQQRLRVSKPGYKPWDRTEPVLQNEETRIQLVKHLQP